MFDPFLIAETRPDRGRRLANPKQIKSTATRHPFKVKHPSPSRSPNYSLSNTTTNRRRLICQTLSLFECSPCSPTLRPLNRIPPLELGRLRFPPGLRLRHLVDGSSTLSTCPAPVINRLGYGSIHRIVALHTTTSSIGLSWPRRWREGNLMASCECSGPRLQWSRLARS